MLFGLNPPPQSPPLPPSTAGANPAPAGVHEGKRASLPEVVFAENLCKGCELCLSVCPTKVLKIDTSRVNARGYYPAVMVNLAECSGCGSCAKICPDSVITVRR